MANRRLLDFSNHIAAPAASSVAAATVTSNNRNYQLIHHHAHLVRAKTLFLSLALVSCLISINCASFGRHEWHSQPKYRLYPAADDSSANESPPAATGSRPLEDLFDQLGSASSGLLRNQQQPVREKLSSSGDDSQLLSYLFGSAAAPPADSVAAGNSYSGNPIQLVGLADYLPSAEFGYVQSEPANYQPHHPRSSSAVDLRDSASFGTINRGVSDDHFQSFTDPRETLLSLFPQQQQQLGQASVLPSGAEIPTYFVGENSQIDNSATRNVVYQPAAAEASSDNSDEPAAGSDENLPVVSKSSAEPAGKLTTLLEEDEAEEAPEGSVNDKQPASDKDQARSGGQSDAASNSSSRASGAKQEHQAPARATINSDDSERQQKLLRRVISIWKNNNSSLEATEQTSSSQQEATGDSQGSSGFLSSLYNAIAQYIPLLGGGSGSAGSSDKQQQQNQDKSGGDKGANRANTKPSVSTQIEPDEGKSEPSSSGAAAAGSSSGSGSSSDSSLHQDNDRTLKAAEDKQPINNDNSNAGKQQQKSGENSGDQEPSDSSISLPSSSLTLGVNVESSPVGTFMASELESAKVVGSSDDVQIASDDKQHNPIEKTTSKGDASNKRNIFRVTTSSLQQPTIGEHKVSLMRHSSLILPLGSDDELVASASSQQPSSLLRRYISSPIGGSSGSSNTDGAGTGGAHNLYFNLQDSRLRKHQSAAATEAGGLSLDDEYTQMSHRSYSRRLHPDDEVYGQFAGLHARPSPQGSSGSFARALPIVGAGGEIGDDQAFCVMAMAVVLATGLFAYRVQQQRKSTSDSDYPTYGVVGPNNMNGKCGGAAAFVGGYFASNLNNHHANGAAGACGPGSTTGGSSLSISGKHLADLYSVSGDSGIVSGVNNRSHHSGTLSAVCGGGSGSAKRANPNAQDGNSIAGQSGGAGNQQGAGNNFMANQNAARMYHYQHQKQQMIISDRASTGRHTSASDLDSEDENDDGSYTVYECPGLASAHEMEIKNPLFNDDRSP